MAMFQFEIVNSANHRDIKVDKFDNLEIRL